ncbi:hypothetical protein LSH36_2776g00005, partial [Paralvinella palmiformis]
YKFLAEFLEVGGVLTVLEILGLRQAKEADKAEALRLVTCVANAGRKYKELICESYGIRAIAECLAKSRSEETQESARHLLQILAQGNPKFEVQVYKGLIALLPCSSPKAQQMAAQTLRVVQLFMMMQKQVPGNVEHRYGWVHVSYLHKFLAEFLEVGGVLTVLEILGLRQAKEADKAEALRLVTCVANAGRKYKELICESYGIRAIAECLAKSRSEETQESARHLLQILAQGNPKFEVQVYKGLIALLPCSSPKAQQMAAQTLRVVQPIVKSANPSIVDPLLNLLKTLHLEVQYEAIELVKDLMDYEVQDPLLKGLVKLLRPAKEDLLNRPDILDDPDVPRMSAPLPVFVQQAAAAKTIGILARESAEYAEKLIQLRVVHNLMYAMGNVDHADSQRQAAISLEYLCRTYPIVDEHVHEAMGDALYDSFMSNPEALYTVMNAVQADVLVSNKVNIPGS